MGTVRRLYFYAITLISVEVVLWGIVNLVRSALDTERVGGGVNQLAGALSVILVGVPVFLLHWLLIQRGVTEDLEERSAGVRATFLYGIMTATLLPSVQNLLAMLDRALMLAFSLDHQDALIGRGQSWGDNVVAVIFNVTLAAYFYNIIQKDWNAYGSQAEDESSIGPLPSPESLKTARRVFRYFWTIYGLGFSVFGIQRVLQYLFELLGLPGVRSNLTLADGIAFVVIGVPIWIGAWSWIQNSLTEPTERRSLFRLATLYALVFVSVAGVLIPTGQVIALTLEAILGESIRPTVFMSEIAPYLATALPLAGVWAYYRRILGQEMDDLPDLPRRTGLRRLYYYLLSLAGIGALFVGIEMTITFLVEVGFGRALFSEVSTRNQLASALATLFVGLPLWLRAWLPMVTEAAQDDEAGDHARRSIVRRIYLFLALFAGVIGVMVSTGEILFVLLRTLLGEPPDLFFLSILQPAKDLVLFGGLLGYHWWALKADGRRAEQSLALIHAKFSVLVLDPGDGNFAESIVSVLQREVPGVPVAVHLTSNGVPQESLSEAQLAILPSVLVAEPSESIRLWLSSFQGKRLVIPVASENWLWLETTGKPIEMLSPQAALAVRQLAEGEAVRLSARNSAWLIFLAILGGLVGLILLISILGEVLNSF